MDIEERISAIMQVRRNREQAGHIWLQGFHEIIDNARLNYEKINEYISDKLSENPPFTKYHSCVQMSKLIQALLNDSEGPIPVQDIDFSSLLKNPDLAIKTMRKKAEEIDFFYVHLPVNKQHHLEFPLINQIGLCRFIYTTCERCGGLEEHGFPEIFLRQSVYFKGNAPTMYGNRILGNHQPPELIRESYRALEDFVIECRTN
ncbi:MAG: hypothetical protein AABW67_06560 [Nanoarchaeota archaeon]